ncbi:Uncharacterised protein [Klebsiella aerogenes]|nr:Uncharacterised protein [Klebsiella aerogenes]
MQYDNAILFQVVDVTVQIMEQDLIVALAVDALTAEVQFGDVLVRYTVTGAFTATVIVVPQHLNTGALQNIQDAFLMVRQFFIVMRARHIGEHTGDGNRSCRAAGGGFREVHHVVLLQAWVSLPIVAAQREVPGARGFAQHHNRQVFAGAAMHHRFLPGIFANLHQRQIVHAVVRIPRVQRHNAVGGTQGFHQLFVVTEHRGVIFVEQRGHQNNQQRRNGDIEQAHRRAAPPCGGLTDFHPPGDEYR